MDATLYNRLITTYNMFNCVLKIILEIAAIFKFFMAAMNVMIMAMNIISRAISVRNRSALVKAKSYSMSINAHKCLHIDIHFKIRDGCHVDVGVLDNQ